MRPVTDSGASTVLSKEDLNRPVDVPRCTVHQLQCQVDLRDE